MILFLTPAIAECSGRCLVSALQSQFAAVCCWAAAGVRGSGYTRYYEGGNRRQDMCRKPRSSSHHAQIMIRSEPVR